MQTIYVKISQTTLLVHTCIAIFPAKWNRIRGSLDIFHAAFSLQSQNFHPAMLSCTNLPLSPEQRNKIVPKTIAPLSNEKGICRQLAANNDASTCLFTVLLGNLRHKAFVPWRITTKDPSRLCAMWLFWFLWLTFCLNLCFLLAPKRSFLVAEI